MKKILLVVLITFTISACSSIQTKDDLVNQQKLEIDKSEQKSELNNEASNRSLNSDGTPLVIKNDPMANIQINSEIKKTYRQTANLIKQKQYPEALSLLFQIEKKYPQLSGSNYQIARIYLLQKKYNQAIKQVDKSLKKNVRNYYSMSLKGVILKSQGKFKEAKSSYLEAIKTFPNYSKSHLNLGVLADVYLGDLNLALSEYKAYMKLTSSNDKKVANWILEVERRLNSTK